MGASIYLYRKEMKKTKDWRLAAEKGTTENGKDQSKRIENGCQRRCWKLKIEGKEIG